MDITSSWDLLSRFQVELAQSSSRSFLRLNFESSIAQQVFLELVEIYSSPERHYHNIEHIKQVLTTIKDLKEQAQNLAAIEFAAWFHDIIYETKSNDNEEKSAEYAEAVLNKLYIPKEIIAATKHIILTTKTHLATENDIDSQIMLDADLAILGADAVEYLRYSQAIKQEYSWISDEQYRVGRRQFLHNVLQRKRIYFTEKMFAALEIKARHNIQEEIKYLSR